MRYQEPIRTSLKQDAWQELQDVKLFIKRHNQYSLLTTTFWLIIIGSISSTAFFQFEKNIAFYYLSFSLFLMTVFVYMQLLIFKYQCFWLEKMHYLNRFINDLPLKKDQRYLPFNIHELTYEPLLSKRLLWHASSKNQLLLPLVVSISIIGYTTIALMQKPL